MKNNLTEWSKDFSVQSPLELMRRQVNNIFDSFFKDSFSDTFSEEQRRSPRMDLVETESDFRLTAELPGMDEGDINISLERGVLTICGEKRQQNEVKEGTFHHVERCFGSFQRAVRLPQKIKEDEVSAVYKNGILAIVLPKSEPDSGVRKIEIKNS